MRSRVLASIVAFVAAGVMLAAQTGTRVTKIGTCNVLSGSGSPETAVTGKVCDMYLRTDGGSGTVIYVKASGTGNTGWETAGTGGGGGTGGTGASPEVVTRKTADQSVTSSVTLVNDLHLTFNVAASETWVAKFVLFVDAGATGDLKVGLSVPSGATYRLAAAATPNTAGTVANQASSTTTVSVGGLGAGTVYAYTLYATIVNSTTAGAVTLQFAQDTSDATATTLKTNSFMVADPVGSASAAATAGSMILLESHTAASSATLDFTSAISSAYDDYVIQIVNVIPATAGAQLQMTMSTTGGASYDTATNYGWNLYVSTVSFSSNAVGGQADSGLTSIRVAHDPGTTASHSVNGTVRFSNPLGANFKSVQIDTAVTRANADAHLYRDTGTGLYLSTAAVNAFRFAFSSGNIASGTIRVYGLANKAQLPPKAIDTGAHASRAGASLDGRVYLPNDGYSVARDNSSTWAPWGPLFPFTAPPTGGSWSWVNQGSATWTEAKDAAVLTSPFTAGQNIAARMITAPATPYTITAYIVPPPTFQAFMGYGLVFRQNGAGTGQNKMLLCAQFAGNAAGSAQNVTRVVRATNATTVGTTDAEVQNWTMPHWFRVTDNGTNLIYSVSNDGQTWVQVFSGTRTTAIDQGPDQVGVFVYTQQTATTKPDIAITLLSWKQS
jgi:hypothetical protein